MNYFVTNKFCVFLVLASARITISKNLDLIILHNNDMHARFEETSKNSASCYAPDMDCVGGFARIAYVVRKARNETENGTGPNVLFLNAGDTYTGTTWFSVHNWKIVADFLNILKPDAMSFGNHEFDQGTAGILPLIDHVNFPIIAANLDFSNNPELLARNIPKSIILGIDGHKIGVIGYLTPQTVQISSPEDIIFRDEVTSIREECERLEKTGVNITIAVGHSGIETDKLIAKEVGCVDVVIGGHTNTFLWNGIQPDLETPVGPYPLIINQNSGKLVPVVQAYAYTKYLGRLHLTFNGRGELIQFHGQPILLNKSIPQEQDVLDMLEKYRPEVKAQYTKVIGQTKVFLEGRSSDFGNYITDCFVEYNMMNYAGPFWTDTSIALIQGGAIRSSINASSSNGHLTRGDILPAVPFGNQLISFNLKGADIIKTLEIGIRNDGKTSHGEFLQVSGLKVTYNLSKPMGSRVTKVKVRCATCTVPQYEDIIADKTYRLITVSFLVNGGDGHYILRNNSFSKVTHDLTDVDVLEWCIKKRSPIYPGLEERIQFAQNSAIARIAALQLILFLLLISF